MRYCIKLIFIITSSVFILANQTTEKYVSGKISFIKELEINENALPEGTLIENPIALALHQNGNIYICDFDACNLKVFTKDGNFVRTIGRKGQGPGDLFWPRRIAVSNNRIIVWEVTNRRISLFSTEGEFIKSRKFSGDTGLPNKIHSLADKYFVVETVKQDYSDNNFPQKVSIELYSLELDLIRTVFTKKIFRSKRITEPRRVDVFQPFNPDVYWDVSTSGSIIMGYSNQYRIEVLDPLKGRTLEFDHEYRQVKVTEVDKEIYFSKMNIGYRTNKSLAAEKKGDAPNYFIENTHFPKMKPAYNAILCDSEGYIWVHRYLSNRESENSFFDIFSPTGSFIDTIEIKGEYEFPYIRTKIANDRFWQIIPNSEGYRIITRFRISY